MKTYYFSQLHEVYYQTKVEANSEQEARDILRDTSNWNMNPNTLVEAGEVELEEVR